MITKLSNFFIEDKTEAKKESSQPPRPESRGVDWKTQVRLQVVSVHHCLNIISSFH